MLPWMLCFFITLNMFTQFVVLGSPTCTVLLPSILTRPQNEYKSSAENSSYQINYLQTRNQNVDFGLFTDLLTINQKKGLFNVQQQVQQLNLKALLQNIGA